MWVVCTNHKDMSIKIFFVLFTVKWCHKIVVFLSSETTSKQRDPFKFSLFIYLNFSFNFETSWWNNFPWSPDSAAADLSSNEPSDDLHDEKPGDEANLPEDNTVTQIPSRIIPFIPLQPKMVIFILLSLTLK